jgi:hypothetical protein
VPRTIEEDVRMRRFDGMIAATVAVALAVPLFATDASAALVICQRKNRIKIRVDECKKKETQVEATELGVTGPPGMDGSAVAFAHVAADGTVDLASSKNVTDTNVSLLSTSAYCFHDLGFSFSHVIATPDYGDQTSGGQEGLESTVALGDPWGDCVGQAGTEVEVATSIKGTFAPAGFFVIFN